MKLFRIIRLRTVVLMLFGIGAAVATAPLEVAAAQVVSNGDDTTQQGEKALAERAYEEMRPHCTAIRFSGVAVGVSPYALSQVHTTKELKRLLAINPLECSPSGITQTYVCRGADILKNQPAYTISWGKTWLQVVAPLDIVDTGTRATTLYIDRTSARCVDKIAPALLPSDNLIAFYKSIHGNH